MRTHIKRNIWRRENSNKWKRMDKEKKEKVNKKHEIRMRNTITFIISSKIRVEIQ